MKLYLCITKIYCTVYTGKSQFIFNTQADNFLKHSCTKLMFNYNYNLVESEH